MRGGRGRGRRGGEGVFALVVDAQVVARRGRAVFEAGSSFRRLALYGKCVCGGGGERRRSG